MEVIVLSDTMTEVMKWLKTPDMLSDSHHLDTLLRLLKKTKDVVKEAEQNSAQNPTVPLGREQVNQLKNLTNDLSVLVEEDYLSKDASAQRYGTVKKRIRIMPYVSQIIQIGMECMSSDRHKVTEDIRSMAGDLEGFASNLSEEGRQKVKELSKLHDKVRKQVEPMPTWREKEKEEIIDRLIPFRNETGKSAVPAPVPVPVVAITGIAGIGKTKLAEIVCRDEEVNLHFGLPIWINGIDDVKSIVKRVTESAGTNRLGFLLVLDDLPGDHSFTKLQRKLKAVGLFAGAILVTTRSSLVGKTADWKVTPYALQGLNEEDSWSLLQLIHELEVSDSVRRKILRKCRGVPLAIITMAMLLKSRGSQVVEAEVAELNKKLLQELTLTYYADLPTHHHKLCFSYCSLFPQDYLIDPNTLIQLWMGDGFLTPSDPSLSHSPEEVGREYFNDFLRMSIFEDVKEDESGVVRSCRMHPLMHDLASVVAGDENITVDLDGQKVHDRVLRASLNFSLDVLRRIPDSLFEKAKNLRTLLLLAKTQSRLPREVKVRTLACDEIFRSFEGLRSLDLHDLGIKMVPSSIGELKKLRYLDLSYSNIEKLPGSITKLKYLQTLKLSQCHVLKELPKDFKDLQRLRHLDIEGCVNLTHMPPGLNKLTSLQTLSHFVASENQEMGGLGELTSLNNLTGRLEIWYLERLKFSASSDFKYLKEKEHLQRLTFRWDHHHDRGSRPHEEELLEVLQPRPNLRALSVVGYGGQKFSGWLPSLNHLVKFSMYNCPRCQFLPPMDSLQSLKILELQRLYSLEFIAENSDNTIADTVDRGKETEEPSSSSSTTMSTPPIVRMFPSLKELTISYCPNLRSWWKTDKAGNSIPFFSCISKLRVQHCPKLTCMPLYPCLDKELVLEGSSVEPLWDTIRYGTSSEASVPLKSMLIAKIEEIFPQEEWLRNFTSLENLHIRDCPHLKFLHEGFEHLSLLQCLTIENCPELDLDRSSTEWEGLKSLCSLTIREIPNLKSLPSSVDKLTSLQNLGLHKCPELTSLPESIDNLTRLRRLVITQCNKLGSLPRRMGKLRSLHALIIIDCRLLLPRCQRETGDDWPQIAHIKNIQVKQSGSYEEAFAEHE